MNRLRPIYSPDYLPPKSIVDFPLYRRLPKTDKPSSDEILNAFLAYVEEKNLVPYATQEEAILELLDDKNVILNTPTGSGKSLVATFLHFQSLPRGLRSVYTCPSRHSSAPKSKVLVPSGAQITIYRL